MYKKTGSTGQGMTVWTRGIFGISTSVGYRGNISPYLYPARAEIYSGNSKNMTVNICLQTLKFGGK